MSVSDIATRLSDRFHLLRGRRAATERHQTLRAAVDWSYGLLDSKEQVLFARLSVFAGWFDLDSAEAVCGADPLKAPDLVHLLSSLVDKSMVVTRTGRYRVLETLRQFGHERLDDRGDAQKIRRQHLDHYVDFAVAADAGIHSQDEGTWSERLEHNWPDLRAAFGWATTFEDLDTAMELVIAVAQWSFFRLRAEFGDWAETALAMPGAATHQLYPSVLGAAAIAAQVRSDFEQAGHHAWAGIDAEHTPGSARQKDSAVP